MKKRESPLAARIALGVPAVIGLFILFTFSVMSYRDDDLLIRTAQVTDGRIAERHCKNHGELVFSYSVNGKSYRGGGICVSTPCEDTEIGAPVQVMYSSVKPQVSDCISPRTDLETRLQDYKRSRYGGFLFPVMLTFFVFAVIFDITRIDDTNDRKPGSD